MSDLIGQMLGPYQITAELGRGGMANVYRAIQPSVKREVAIKILPAHFLQDQSFLARFNREAEVIARLQHPRILPIYDYGEHAGQPYIVMAYLPGGTLTDRIKQSPGGLPLDETARLVAQIAEALDYAHRKGIIHRDFKPSNVLLDEDGNVHLADFGIAKVSADTAHLTGSGIVGTPQYMAPEMSDPDGLSPLVDIYALGVTLYQMLTGRHPYEAPTPMGVLLAHANKPIPDARKHRPDLPDAAQAVIETAMAKNPADRYQSAGEMAKALAGAAQEAPSGTPETQAMTPPPSVRPRQEAVTQTELGQQALSGVMKGTGDRRSGLWTYGVVVALALIVMAVVAGVILVWPGGGTPATVPPADAALDSTATLIVSILPTEPAKATDQPSGAPTATVQPSATAAPPSQTPTATVAPANLGTDQCVVTHISYALPAQAGQQLTFVALDPIGATAPISLSEGGNLAIHVFCMQPYRPVAQQFYRVWPNGIIEGFAAQLYGVKDLGGVYQITVDLAQGARGYFITGQDGLLHPLVGIGWDVQQMVLNQPTPTPPPAAIVTLPAAPTYTIGPTNTVEGCLASCPAGYTPICSPDKTTCIAYTGVACSHDNYQGCQPACDAQFPGTSWICYWDVGACACGFTIRP